MYAEEEMRTLFTHSTPPSHISILALKCRLQLSLPNLLQTREGLHHSVHLYSVSLLKTNEPCS